LGEYPMLLFHGPQLPIVTETMELRHILNDLLKIVTIFPACDKSKS